MNRRFFLRSAAALGCSVAAHPFLSTVTFAGSDGRLGENRLIVVILRGAMDGLDVVQPVGDPLFAAYRATLGTGAGTTPLERQFALHEALGELVPLWQAGELAFAHATSTPYRDKRSHFDGQDILEAGTGTDVPAAAHRDGWLNRMLQAVPGLSAETAYAVGIEALPLLTGKAEVRSWVPDLRLELSAQSRLLLEAVYHDDPLFRDSAVEAMQLTAELDAAGLAEGGMDGTEAGMDAGMGGGMEAGMDATSTAAPAPAAPVRGREAEARLGEIDSLVDFAAGRLRGETRIASFSLSGWDTHRNQSVELPKQLLRLQRTVTRLKAQLGPQVWGRTTVLAMTEFGRTVHENGSKGTDHGTAGVMMMAGGAVRGGRIYGRWPGLAEADLYDRRDLMPTSDVRDWAAWAMHGLYGFDKALLERSVFPGLVMGDDPRFIL